MLLLPFSLRSFCRNWSKIKAKRSQGVKLHFLEVLHIPPKRCTHFGGYAKTSILWPRGSVSTNLCSHVSPECTLDSFGPSREGSTDPRMGVGGERCLGSFIICWARCSLQRAIHPYIAPSIEQNGATCLNPASCRSSCTLSAVATCGWDICSVRRTTMSAICSFGMPITSP
jgi:hypothetical protein